jgi:hypothetical protein
MLVVLRDVVSELAKQEARAWLPLLSRKIVRQTTEALPAHQQDLLEDMEAQLNERSDRPITMLLFAIRVARDRRLIVVEGRGLALESAEAISQKDSVSVRAPIAGAVGTFKQAVGAMRSMFRWATKVVRQRTPWKVELYRRRAVHRLSLVKAWLSALLVLALFIVALSQLVSSDAMAAIAVWPANHTVAMLALPLPLAGVGFAIRHFLRRKR